MINTTAVAGLFVLSVTSGQPAAAPDAAQSAGRPNIVLICMEGVPVTATGFGGHPHVKTPHLDAIAAQSAEFLRAYTPIPQSAGARASMLTGQFPHTHGVTDDTKHLRTEGTTVSEALSAAGYRCGLVGTWRLPDSPALPGATRSPGPAPANAAVGHPEPHTAGHPAPPPGFMHPPEVPLGRPTPPHPEQDSPHAPGSASATDAATQPAGTQPAETEPAEPIPPVEVEPPPPPPVEKPGLGFDFSATSNLGGPLTAATVYVDGRQKLADKYLPEWHANQAVEFIRASRDQPFFLCVFLPGPPEPLNYPPGAEGSYPPDSLPKPRIKPADQKNLPARLRTMPVIQNAPKQPEQLREQQSKYYAFVTETDQHIGRVMGALKDANLDEQTLVVVTADQGFATGENGAWGMGPAFWEDLVRCPLLVRMPGSLNNTARSTSGKDSLEDGMQGTQPEKAEHNSATMAEIQACKTGTRIEVMVSLVDLAPTLLEVVGLSTHPNMQGRSLLPLIIRGEDPYRSDECFIEYEQANGQVYPARVLVAGQYKLVEYLQDSDQFYDLRRDPQETHNLVDERAYAAVLKVMRSRLDHWRKKTRDTGR